MAALYTEDGQKFTAVGKYIVILKRGADGLWRLHRDIWNDGL